ncbi:hypothetical protein B5P45_18415 [Phyllobacterium zundukense]|uniref:Uncharacterized protein n=1 Tax=Phyllobacterium zundukense TaxID=1867719 RepID=A0A2N9VVF3_9HYPH|nr:hypothetical protein B5P45_18415 [Phyllobacterium zundukense]
MGRMEKSIQSGRTQRRLPLAGCTGHSLRDVNAILDSNYLNRDPELGESAIRKLEKRTRIPD